MTILFRKDWFDAQGKPRAVVQKNTKNFSFIRMVAILSEMGVKNNLFHLSLYDPKLLDVDPHKLNATTDPTGELRLRVAYECKRNVWYYLREIVRIPASGGDPIHFQLNRGNLSMTWCFLNSIDYNGTQPRQTGKAVVDSTLVRIPGGWAPIATLKVGDNVIAADGSTTIVTGVYPQGVVPLYRIKFEDGREIDSCAEHQWLVHNPHWSPEDTRWRVIQTKDIWDRFINHPTSEARFAIPLVQPEQNPDVDLPLDPYVVGALLGDGDVSGTSANLCCPDQFIADEFKKVLPESVVIERIGPSRFKIMDRDRVGTSSRFLQNLEKTGIRGKRAWEKEIPEAYMKASAKQRLHLLQGLMDTDGTVDKKGSVSYCTTSRTMAYQFRQLIWSLGGICKIKERQTHYTWKGEKKPGRLAYNIRFRFADHKCSLRLPRKREVLHDTYKHADRFKLHIQSIERVSPDSATCIEVAHPQNLFVIENDIVTHNTIGAITLSSWILYINGYNMSMTMLTHSDKLVQENVKRLKDIRSTLPAYLIQKSGDDIDNKQGLDYKVLKNSYLTYIGQKDKQAANRVGRGSTSPSIHFDELAFTPNIRITFPAIMAATNRARQNAANAGMIHSNIYTTTAGDPSTDEGAFAHDRIKKSMPFTEKLYDSEDREKALEIVGKNSTIKMVNGTFSYLQLGLTKEWFLDTITRNSVPPDEVQRDYLNNWVCMAKNPIIPKETLDIMSTHRKNDPTYQEILGDFVISWYLPESTIRSSSFKKKLLILGMDSSENIGRDFTTFVCIDPATLATVFTFRCNDSNTTKIGMLVARILNEYPRMLFVPERKNSGVFIVDMVITSMRRAGDNPFTRIYNRVVQDRQYEEFSRINLHDPNLSDTTDRKYLGFMTTGTSRDVLYKQVLQRAASLAKEKVYDPTLISELSGLQASNGRIDHRAGKHDDMCFTGETLVRTDRGNRPIRELAVGDLVLTREGYKPILHIYCHEKEVITKYGLTGTHNHPFITPSGIVEFEHLMDESKVYEWDEKQSCIVVNRITDTRSHRTCICNGTSTDVTSIRQRGEPPVRKEVVYNLCVAECHEYFANDILVHNCIAWLLACFVIFEGKNLEMYGIHKDELIKTLDYGFSGNIDPAKVEEQMTLRRMLKDLNTRLANTSSPSVRSFLNQERSRLEQFIDPSIILEPVSIDAVKKDFSEYEYVPGNTKLDRMNVNMKDLNNVALGGVPYVRNQGQFG